MRRRHVFLLAIPVIVLIVVFTGWNRTSAEDRSDQTVDFRLNQIMVRLNQIEWELSRVRNRQGTQDKRLDEIDAQLNRILAEIVKITSMAPASSSTATDPALAGAWRLTRNDFADEIPKNIRRYQEELAEERRGTERFDSEARREANRIRENTEETVSRVLDGYEKVLDSTGLRLIRFRSDGMYTDSTGDEGLWLVSGDRLILTTFEGRAYPVTFFMDGAELTLTISGDQLGTMFKLEAAEAGRLGRRGRDLIDHTFKYTDRVRLFYAKDP